MKLFTIGFTKKSASRFFELLRSAGVRRVLDTRLNNRSQLAGFSKGDDLEYFLKAVGKIAYRYTPELAPTQEILDQFKKLGGLWADYERQYLKLLSERTVERSLTPSLLEDACLLCSEHEPNYCHRRLAAEYLQRLIPGIKIAHLM